MTKYTIQTTKGNERNYTAAEMVTIVRQWLSQNGNADPSKDEIMQAADEFCRRFKYIEKDEDSQNQSE